MPFLSQASTDGLLRPEAAGLNGLILDGLKNHLGSLAGANIRSVLVVRRGTFVYESLSLAKTSVLVIHLVPLSFVRTRNMILGLIPRA